MMFLSFRVTQRKRMTEKSRFIQKARHNMIDQKTVCIITPTRDGQVCTDYAGGLAACAGLYGGISFVVGMSVVSLARCLVVHSFLKREQFEHLVMIGSDIGFLPDDLNLLMEEHLLNAEIKDDEGRQTHLVVCAEYGKRATGAQNAQTKNAQFGLGFTRVHRS